MFEVGGGVNYYFGSLPFGEGWGGASQPEIRYKEVFELTLRNPEMKDSVFMPSETDKLKEIAQLCPFVEGNAVYMARVILHAIDPFKDYINSCEFAKDPKRTSNERRANNNDENYINDGETPNNNTNYAVVPNPNNGTFNLFTKTNESINCTITDVTGKIVLSGLFKPTSNNISFNLNHLSKGLYHLKLVDDNDCITIKIIIN